MGVIVRFCDVTIRFDVNVKAVINNAMMMMCDLYRFAFFFFFLFNFFFLLFVVAM